MLTQNQPAGLNHVFFASPFVWCLAWQASLSPQAAKYGPVHVAKALHVQPKTPPPVFDPEVTNTSWDSAERNGNGL